MDNIFVQRPSVIDLVESKVIMMLEDEVKVALELSERAGHVGNDCYFEHERVVTGAEIKKSLEVMRITSSGFSVSEAIAGIREKEIKLSVLCLCDRVYEKYRETALKLGLKISPYNFLQVVETPFCHLDFTPGDTAIRFKIFTRREIRPKFLEK